MALLMTAGARPAAVSAQAGNGFSAPAPGDVLAGVVVVQGTAVHPSFLRYEVAFLNESNPGAGWIVFAQGDQPVASGTLALWDTTVGGPANPVFPDGRYQLRLRVVRADSNYDEFFVTNLTIANAAATPSPTATEVGPLPAPTAAPAASVSAPFIPDALPTLTPFPTPSPQATSASVALGPAAPGDDVESVGLLDRLGVVDASQFSRAFWFGVRAVVAVFLLLGLYLILRAVGRWAWRLVSGRLWR
ncbi:MAG: hypothetical protein ACRDHL_03075 [Candidatus Promineifilaceae bacterium]